MKTKAKDRKILYVGGSYLLTLPPEFIKQNNLKPGDRLGLTYNSILVIVHPVMPEEKNDEKR